MIYRLAGCRMLFLLFRNLGRVIRSEGADTVGEAKTGDLSGVYGYDMSQSTIEMFYEQ